MNIGSLKKKISSTAVTSTTTVFGGGELETWPNPYPDRNYVVDISFPEFTCLCPRSGYPDFATIKLQYTPDALIVELKALKLYLNGFRDRRVGHEDVTNEIYTKLYTLLQPREMTIIGDFNVRGNVKTIVTVSSNTANPAPVPPPIQHAPPHLPKPSAPPGFPKRRI